MSAVNYSKISILVADDFSSFRNTINGMLTNLGVLSLEMASNAGDTIKWCESRAFDVVLCDYNLGAGRTGQHVLEELRHRRLITRQTLFIIVSAEASRNIVMCSYDCEPDDYLMKPITARMLQQRIERLLLQRSVMSPALKALDTQDYGAAVDQLVDLAAGESRYSGIAQKMLGTVFLEMGDFDKAERLYTRALEARQLDWARLGLAKVKQARGELDVAGAWLEKIVEENPLYLPAYDSLADNWERRGERFNVQYTVQRAVDISPMSILRQKQLAAVAADNSDFVTAVDAQRKAVKLGHYSCFGRPEDHFSFARYVSTARERELDVDPGAGNEALAVLDQAKEVYPLSAVQLAQCNLLTGRLHALEKRPDIAIQFLDAAAESLEHGEADIAVELDRLQMLQALGRHQDAEQLLKDLQQRFANDQAALEKLDVFLNEPASASNREFVADINREGIELYNNGQYDEALACFEKARKLFPKHVGIQLNIVQSLIGKLKLGDDDDLLSRECRSSLELVSSLINDQHPQYSRFKKLQNMAMTYEH